MDKYGVQAYFCGHNHALGFANNKGIAYYRSGAGGNYGGDEGGLPVIEGNRDKYVYGFLRCRLTYGKMFARYHYTYDKKKWEFWDAPVWDMDKGEEIEPD